MLVAACGTFGYAQLAAALRRERLVEAMCSSLELLRAEIATSAHTAAGLRVCYRLQSLRRAGSSIRGWTRRWMRSASWSFPAYGLLA